MLIRTVAASLKRHVHGRNFAARIGADDFVLVHYSLDESGDPTDVTELARVLPIPARRTYLSGRENPTRTP